MMRHQRRWHNHVAVLLLVAASFLVAVIPISADPDKGDQKKDAPKPAPNPTAAPTDVPAIVIPLPLTRFQLAMGLIPLSVEKKTAFGLNVTDPDAHLWLSKSTDPLSKGMQGQKMWIATFGVNNWKFLVAPSEVEAVKQGWANLDMNTNAQETYSAPPVAPLGALAPAPLAPTQLGQPAPAPVSPGKNITLKLSGANLWTLNQRIKPFLAYAYTYSQLTPVQLAATPVPKPPSVKGSEFMKALPQEIQQVFKELPWVWELAFRELDYVDLLRQFTDDLSKRKFFVRKNWLLKRANENLQGWNAKMNSDEFKGAASKYLHKINDFAKKIKNSDGVAGASKIKKEATAWRISNLPRMQQLRDKIKAIPASIPLSEDPSTPGFVHEPNMDFAGALILVSLPSIGIQYDGTKQPVSPTLMPDRTRTPLILVNSNIYKRVAYKLTDKTWQVYYHCGLSCYVVFGQNLLNRNFTSIRDDLPFAIKGEVDYFDKKLDDGGVRSQALKEWWEKEGEIRSLDALDVGIQRQNGGVVSKKSLWETLKDRRAAKTSKEPKNQQQQQQQGDKKDDKKLSKGGDKPDQKALNP